MGSLVSLNAANHFHCSLVHFLYVQQKTSVPCVYNVLCQRLSWSLADLFFEEFSKGVNCAMCDGQETVCSPCPMYSQAKFHQTGKRGSCTSVALGVCFIENPGLFRLDRTLYSWPSGLSL